MARAAKQFYEFGPFRIDASERQLLRGGEVVPLTPKVFDTLLVLVENSGHILSKNELMSKLWPDTAVEENNLTVNISTLRKALGESPDQHQYIETIPWRGYRFAASVRDVREDVADLIVEERSRSRVVIEQQINAPAAQAELEPTAIEKSLAPASNVKRGTKRKLTLVVCAAFILVAIAVSFLWTRSSSKGTPTGVAIKSIAVLPFKSLGPEVDDEYLQLGLADTLITRLSNIKQIVVRPISAVRRYANENQDPLVAGREQRVDAVLDGSIHRSEGRIRVTARLVNVQDGSSLWAGSFDEKYEDIFRLQDSIVEKLAGALALSLTGEEEKRLAKRYTESSEAYQAYVKGRLWWNKRSGEGFKRAIEFFNEAIALDRNYALPYAGLADCYALMSPNDVAGPKEGYPKAKAAATQALAIDDQLAEAHTSLAHITWLYEWDFQTAEAGFKRAIELDPNYPSAHQWYSVYLSSMARHDEAIREAKLAHELDPLSLPIIQDLARAYYHARHYDQAIATSLKALELNPEYYRLNSWLELAYAQKGLYDQAIEVRLKAMSLIGVDTKMIASLKVAYAASGWRGYWQKELDLTTAKSPRRYLFAFFAARIHARLGENDQALEWLEKAYEERLDHLVLLKVDPIFDPLRADPRFTDLLRRIGLAP